MGKEDYADDYENENENDVPVNGPDNDDDDPVFETTPEAATDLKSGGDLKPKFFKRKNILIMICVSLSAVVLICLFLNMGKDRKKSSANAEDEYIQTAASSREFINTLHNQAVRNSQREARNQQAQEGQNTPVINEEAEEEIEALLPPVVIERQRPEPPPAPAQPQHQPPPPQQQGGGGYNNNQQQQQPTHLRSPLVPQVQGNLFASQTQQPQNYANTPSSAAGNSVNPYDFYSSLPPNQTPAANQYGYANQGYTAQNNQANKQDFYSSSSEPGALYGGMYLGENCIWAGTIISGVLETAINTDLPGHVIARVTNNVYDSQTGRQLLIPQGSVLIARYNSSVSYAQSRVQIVWDTLIRPDGYQISLGSAPGVDREGMAGQAAKYNENWFEYVKAAGIITMFSIANAEITETVAKYSADTDTAANVAADNAQVMNQLGSNIINRALDIQPTLTVRNGTVISVMLNNALYLPPLKAAPTVQKYQLRR